MSEQNPQYTSVAHTVATGIQTRLTSSGQGSRIVAGWARCRTTFLNTSFLRKVKTALVAERLGTFRNTNLQTWVHKHCQKGQANLLIVCLHGLFSNYYPVCPFSSYYEVHIKRNIHSYYHMGRPQDQSLSQKNKF